MKMSVFANVSIPAAIKSIIADFLSLISKSFSLNMLQKTLFTPSTHSTSFSFKAASTISDIMLQILKKELKDYTSYLDFFVSLKNHSVMKRKL